MANSERPPRKPGIYRIDAPSGGFYIGSTVNLRKRENEHRGHLRRLDHFNPALNAASAKFGHENLLFSVVLICERSILREMEQRVIDAFCPRYNVAQTVGNFLGDLWLSPEFSESASRRCSEKNKERWQNPEYRAMMKGHAQALHTPEARAASKASRAAMFSSNSDAADRVRRAASETMKRLHNDPDFKARHSARVSAAARKRLADPVQRAALFEAAGKSASRPLYCITTGQYFGSIGSAASSLGVSVSLIRKQMRGERTKTGYVWRDLRDDELHLVGMVKRKQSWPDPKYKGGRKPKGDKSHG